ncbi:MAG: hypothetical protein R3B72_31735 [Polyangiaceae bacterium]
MRPLVLLPLFAVALVACGENQTFVERDAYQPPPIEPLACVPNLDGQISGAELSAAIGVQVRYLVSPAGVERDVDVVGYQEEGATVWDFGIDLADDQEIVVVPETTEGKWYESAFPADTFVTPFDAGGRVESVGRLDETGLYLLGLASAVPDPPEGQTFFVYDTPIKVLAFPVRPGTSHSSSASVTGATLRGLPYAGTDTYDVTVDGIGALDLPQLRFQEAHRVRTEVTVEPAVGAVTTQRQVSWFVECFGEVTRATSRLDEPAADFSIASEVRRLGFR